MTGFLLSMDFMCANDCEWLVSKGRILIRGHLVPLVKCTHKANVCCVIVRNSIVVPADFAMTVPVTSISANADGLRTLLHVKLTILHGSPSIITRQRA